MRASTAADAFFRGYQIWVPEDGVFSPKPEDTKRALEWLASYCAIIAPSSEILERLRESDDLPGRGEEALA